MRVYNFSAGPSMLPEEVLKQVANDFVEYKDFGLSVTEMSHRSKVYEAIHNETIALFKELLNLNDDYTVLFLQGGASMQFEAIPLNLLVKGKADYVVTGNFASTAYKQAQKFGDIVKAASSEDKNFTYIPDMSGKIFRDDIDYIHLTSNNTIFGTKINNYPKTATPLVVDMSSNILSERMDYSQFSLIYAGAQKNIGPSGLTVVIVKKSLIGNAMPICPTMMKYSTQADANSLYNTPPTFAIYMAGLTLKWIKDIGGMGAIEQRNLDKAAILYNYIDNSTFYSSPVVVKDRSIMNVPFVSKSKELDDLFCKQAEKAGLLSIKGHRLVGGMRASIYNAMPIDGVKSLVSFMENFAKENK